MDKCKYFDSVYTSNTDYLNGVDLDESIPSSPKQEIPDYDEFIKQIKKEKAEAVEKK